MDLNLGDTQFIIQTCLGHGLLRNQAAYVLATAYHETAYTMKPIHEYGGLSYLESKPYWPYIGRGYVQLTWKANYEKAGSKLHQDFVTHPDLLLQAQFAAPILVIGMVEGWFTGKKLSDYITLQHSDFVGARHIINGNDRAQVISSYANAYDHKLTEIGYGTTMVTSNAPVITPAVVVQTIPVVPAPVQPEISTAPVAPPVVVPAPIPTSTIPQHVSWWEALVSLFLVLFRRSK